MKDYGRCLLAACLLLAFPCALGLRFSILKPGQDIFGQVQSTVLHTGDTWLAIARHYDVGYDELAAANPRMDPEHLIVGTVLIIPTQYVLPPVRRGIVINVANMRLYYFPKDEPYFYTYPIGIGRRHWQTPWGALHVIQKIRNPAWIMPASIIKYRRAQGGKVSHSIVPSGPDNPLGKYAVRLSQPTYLIHGTNHPASVGRRSSAGCVHLYPEDIQALFEHVSISAPVVIINRPFLLGWQEGRLYLEARRPLLEQRAKFNLAATIFDLFYNFLGDRFQAHAIRWDAVYNVLREPMGIPIAIGSSSAYAARLYQ